MISSRLLNSVATPDLSGLSLSLPVSAFVVSIVGCSVISAVSVFSAPDLPLFEAVTVLASFPVPVVPCTSSAFTPPAVATVANTAAVVK